MKTSKIIILLGLLFLSSFCKGQIPVTDVAAGGQLALLNKTGIQNVLKNSAILGKAVSSLKALDGMQSTYNEWSDAVRKVNGNIQSGKKIINISNKVTDIGRLYGDAVEILANENSINITQKEIFFYVFTEMLNRSISELDSSITITSNGIFEMNDSERLTFIDKIDKAVTDTYKLMIYSLKKLKYAVRKANSNKNTNDFFNNTLNSNRIKD